MPSWRASDGRIEYITDWPAPMQVRLTKSTRKARRRSSRVVTLTNVSPIAAPLASRVGRSSAGSSSAAAILESKPLQEPRGVKRSLRLLEAYFGAIAAAFGIDDGDLRETFAFGHEKHRLKAIEGPERLAVDQP